MQHKSNVNGHFKTFMEKIFLSSEEPVSGQRWPNASQPMIGQILASAGPVLDQCCASEGFPAGSIYRSMINAPNDTPNGNNLTMQYLYQSTTSRLLVASMQEPGLS